MFLHLKNVDFHVEIFNSEFYSIHSSLLAGNPSGNICLSVYSVLSINTITLTVKFGGCIEAVKPDFGLQF